MPQEPTNQQNETIDLTAPAVATPGHEPRKKRLMIGLIAVVVAVLVGGGGWAVYALWYQNPDKVVLDALINAASAKTVTTSGSISSGTKYQITFKSNSGHKEGASGTMSIATKGNNGSDLKLELAGVHSSSGDDFVKITNLKAAIDSFGQLSKLSAPGSGQEALLTLYDSLLQPFITKVDGKWVKVTPDDVKKISGQLGENYDCLEKNIDNLNTDSDKLVEIGTMYWNNAFIVVKQKLGEKAGNFGYVLGIDNAKARRFAGALKTSKLFQDIKACYASADIDPNFDKLTDASIGRTEVWIDQWSHQLRSVHSVGEDKSVLDMQTTFNQPIAVTPPNNPVVLSDIFSEFTKSFMSNYSLLFKDIR